jgi:nicotinamidase-related amidase
MLGRMTVQVKFVVARVTTLRNGRNSAMAMRADFMIDLQKDYLAGRKLPLHQIDAASEKAAREIEDAHSRGCKAIHILQVWPAGPILMPGSDRAEIIPAEVPRSTETVITDTHSNSCRDTAPRQVLDQDGARNVVIIGARRHMCVGATAHAAADQNHDTIIAEEACATLDVEFGGVRVPVAHVHLANTAARTLAQVKVV